jgi:hypothetical protein
MGEMLIIMLQVVAVYIIYSFLMAIFTILVNLKDVNGFSKKLKDNNYKWRYSVDNWVLFVCFIIVWAAR